MFRLLLLVVAISASQAFLFNAGKKWDDLRLTWGPNPFSDSYYAKMPRNRTDAVNKGWLKISQFGGCDKEAKWRGHRYIHGGDYAVILIFDVNDYIAGIQTSVPSNLTSGYPSANIRPPFVRDVNPAFHQDNYVVTAYFVNPEKICTTGRTKEEFESQGTGLDLYLQLSDIPEDSVLVPREEKLVGYPWTEGKCFYTMGKHYWYNLTYNMNCDNFLPVFLLYNNGKLNAFGWAIEAAIKSPRMETPPRDKISLFMEFVPKCIAEGTQPLSTMHIYMTEHPMYNKC